jgi:hypothetical protein
VPGIVVTAAPAAAAAAAAVVVAVTVIMGPPATTAVVVAPPYPVERRWKGLCGPSGSTCQVRTGVWGAYAVLIDGDKS